MKENIDLLEEAKKRYPVGCIYLALPYATPILVTPNFYPRYYGYGTNRIMMEDGCGLVYKEGEWAKVLSTPELYPIF